MIERLARQLGKEERDLLVLAAVLEHQPIESADVAAVVGVDEHKARHSLRMLENDELVEPTPDGAVAADDVRERIDAINGGLDGLMERVEELKRVEF